MDTPTLDALPCYRKANRMFSRGDFSAWIRYNMPMKTLLLMIFLLPLSVAAQPPAALVQGQASVIDGDTIDIHGQRIRLHGVDAPESSQLCYLNGKGWQCGKASAWELAKKTQGKTVSCQVKDKDRYGRLVADCLVGGKSVNAQQVEEGWALAYAKYSKDFVPHQERARAARRGIWSSQWSSPEQFRRQKGKGK